MLRTVKNIAVFLLVAVMFLSFAGCHKAGEIAVKIGEIKFTSAFYAAALVSADMEAQEKVKAESDDTTSELGNEKFLKKTIDGVAYKEWVKTRAIEICKELYAAKLLCDENNVSTATAIELAKSEAVTTWNSGYSDFYTQNGIGLETFKNFCVYEQYTSSFFTSLYGEGGKQEVPTADIQKHLNDNYLYFNMITVNITDMSDDEQAKTKNELDGYADRIKKGEAFAKIYAECYDSTYSADKTDDGVFSNSMAYIWSSEGTSYANEHYKQLSSIKKGEITVTVITDETTGDSIAALIVMGDMHSEGNTNADLLKSAALQDLKGEEFEKLIDEKAATLTVEEVTYATKQFKVENIYYPETTTY